MPGTSPIPLGSAATSTLIPDALSRIITDDFGIQHGTVHYNLGDQSLAQSARIAPGTSYSGSLPQFSGFYVEKSGDIVGEQANTASLDITYAKIDSLWIKLPDIGVETEMLQVRLGTVPTGLEVMESLYNVTVPVPHRTASYTFSASSPTNAIGTYSSSLTGVVEPQPYLFKLNQFRTTYANMTSISNPVGVVVVQTELLQCTTDFFAGPALINATVQTNQSLGDALHITFVPDPQGWLCVQDDSRAICNGAIYEISQKWVRSFLFSAISGGITQQPACIPI